MGEAAAKIDSRIARAIIGALREHDLAGFELWHWLGPVRGAHGILDEPGLYPTLHRLETQGLIAGTWREEGGTRRTYRITAAGKAEAERNGWGLVAPIGHRGNGRSPAGSAEDDGEWTWRSEPDASARGQDRLEYRAVEAYVAELDERLCLDSLHRHDAEAEIGDHLSASIARREAEGERPQQATERAIADLGPAELLAKRISEAQLTRGRLLAGLSWGSAVGMLTSFATLAVVFCVTYFVTPIAADALGAIASLLGIHLYAPGTSEWRAEQVAVSGWIGAFVGGRRSTPHFALRSHRSEVRAWHIWGGAGGLFLAVLVAVFPMRMDAFAALALAGIPLAWILGTRRPNALYGETVTLRGVAIAVAVASLALMAPGARVWAYDSSSVPPHAAPYLGGAPVTSHWSGEPGELTGRMEIQVAAGSGWSQARLEVWPAVESGLGVGPDRNALEPTAVAGPGEQVDLSALSHSVKTWWLVVTAVGPDGVRHSVESSPHIGFRRHPRSSIAGWLLGFH